VGAATQKTVAGENGRTRARRNYDDLRFRSKKPAPVRGRRCSMAIAARPFFLLIGPIFFFIEAKTIDPRLSFFIIKQLYIYM